MNMAQMTTGFCLVSVSMLYVKKTTMGWSVVWEDVDFETDNKLYDVWRGKYSS